MKLLRCALFVLGVSLCLFSGSPAAAQKEGKGKEGNTIDLNKLPPELAKALQKFIHDHVKHGPKGKGNDHPKDKKDHPKDKKDHPKGPEMKDKKDHPKDKKDHPKGPEMKDKKDHPKDKKGEQKFEPRPVRNVTLSEAIAIAERDGRGTARKAEGHEKGGELEYRIEIVSTNGERTRIVLDSRGNRIDHAEPADKKGKDKK